MHMDEDSRPGGEVFFQLCDELQNISFQNLLSMHLQSVIETTTEKYCSTEEMTEKVMSELLSRFLCGFPEMSSPS